MNCAICGTPSGRWFFCYECKQQKDRGEIIKCQNCHQWNHRSKYHETLCPNCYITMIKQKNKPLPENPKAIYTIDHPNLAKATITQRLQQTIQKKTAPPNQEPSTITIEAHLKKILDKYKQPNETYSQTITRLLNKENLPLQEEKTSQERTLKTKKYNWETFTTLTRSQKQRAKKRSTDYRKDGW